MLRTLLAARLLTTMTWMAWVGGFMFYGAVVVPVLHDELDSLFAGGITRRVTDALNALGAAAIALGWWTLRQDRRRAKLDRAPIRQILLTTSTTLLIVLLVLHREMDRRLDQGSLAGFYPWHRAYLVTSTTQWAVNVILIGQTLRAWMGSPIATDVARDERPRCGGDSGGV